MTRLTVSTEVPDEIRMTREFDAPRRLLVKAMTTPALIQRWMSNSCSTMTLCEFDARVGGRYRYVFRNADGSEFTFTGEIRELADDRVVFTQAFNDQPGAALVTTTFVEERNRTTMTVTMRFESQQVRDLVVSTGMEVGAGESYDRLEALVAGL